MILVAGGTGFAPIKSLVEHAIHSRIERPMEIYWGARDRAGLYLPALP
jgi:CDP-4-dehydro-6-deoxyglucose reductase